MQRPGVGAWIAIPTDAHIEGRTCGWIPKCKMSPETERVCVRPEDGVPRESRQIPCMAKDRQRQTGRQI